jgi:hypothetical protein
MFFLTNTEALFFKVKVLIISAIFYCTPLFIKHQFFCLKIK